MALNSFEALFSMEHGTFFGKQLVYSLQLAGNLTCQGRNISGVLTKTFPISGKESSTALLDEEINLHVKQEEILRAVVEFSSPDYFDFVFRFRNV